MSLISSQDLGKPGNLDAVVASLKADTMEPAPSENSAPKDDVDSALPEKFKGKSKVDVVNMYLNLERDHGRLSNDLGTQRKLTDRLLDIDRSERARQTQVQQASAAASSPKLADLTSTELLTDPAGAIRKVISEQASQLVEPTRKKMAELESELAAERFMKRHPQCTQIAQSAEWQAWLNSSPVRQRAANQAASGDMSAADALFTEYEDSLKAAAQRKAGVPDESAEQAAIEAARRAGLESGAEASGGRGQEGTIYRRADLIQLKIERPDVYSNPDFQEKILKAYAEGRVR